MRPFRIDGPAPYDHGMTSPTPQQHPGSTRFNNATIVAGVLLFVAVLAAAVALAYTGMETGTIVGFLTAVAGVGGTIVALLDKLTWVQRTNVAQDEKLDAIGEKTDAIEHKVNGELDARLRAQDERLAAAAEQAAENAAARIWDRITNGQTVELPHLRKPVAEVDEVNHPKG